MFSINFRFQTYYSEIHTKAVLAYFSCHYGCFSLFYSVLYVIMALFEDGAYSFVTKKDSFYKQKES